MIRRSRTLNHRALGVLKWFRFLGFLRPRKVWIYFIVAAQITLLTLKIVCSPKPFQTNCLKIVYHYYVSRHVKLLLYNIMLFTSKLISRRSLASILSIPVSDESIEFAQSRLDCHSIWGHITS